MSSYGEKAITLLREIKQREVLPPYNGDAIRDVIAEIHFLHRTIESTIDTLGDRASEVEYAVGMFVRHQTNLRNKQCVMAYLMHRLDVIAKERWVHGPVPTPTIKANMSPEESAFFNDYSLLVSEYMNDVGQDISVRMETPPKDLFVQVRVVEDIGEVMTAHGLVSLKANTTHFIRKEEIERFLREGKVVYIS